MATLQENVQTIKDSVARMKVALELPETTPLEDLTVKIEEGISSGAGYGPYKIGKIYGVDVNIPIAQSFTNQTPYAAGVISAVDVSIPTVTNITNSIYEEV